jgi:hypothetical protein
MVYDVRRKGAGRTNAGAHSSRETNVDLVFQNLIVPADGISAANCENGGFGMSPFFWAALAQATTCHCLLNWRVEHKAQ